MITVVGAVRFSSLVATPNKVHNAYKCVKTDSGGGWSSYKKIIKVVDYVWVVQVLFKDL